MKTTNSTHGLSKSKVYRRWADIKSRCYNKNDSKYKSYGGIGVAMYKPWISDFLLFYISVTSLPGYCGMLTLDRIDGNKGYRPGNLRWVDRRAQATNRRFLNNNQTGHIGVKEIKGRFYPRVTTNGVVISLGGFSTPQDAGNARKRYIDKHNLTGYESQYEL